MPFHFSDPPCLPWPFGAYTLIEKVADGALARVYRSKDPGGRPVAIKIPKAIPGSDAGRRFEHELDALSRLRHPALLSLLDVGLDQGMGRYLVTPWIEGRTLRDFCSGTRLSPEAAMVLLCPLLEGLSALHRAGFVHRDLKPENVMVTTLGRLVILDFGLVHHWAQSRLTLEGTVVGSVPYMSPEQIQGGAVTPQSDLWSVAVMVYEWVAGHRPFQRALQTEEVAAILQLSHPPLDGVDPRVPSNLSALLEGCLCLDPAGRPKNAEEMLARVHETVDWVHPSDLQRELLALLSEPKRFEETNRERRVLWLMDKAQQDARSGEFFSALSALERALAYQPDHPEIQKLVDRVIASGGLKSPLKQDAGNATSGPVLVFAKRRFSRKQMGFLVAAMACFLFGGWWMLRKVSKQPPSWKETSQVPLLPGLRPIPIDTLSNNDPPWALEQQAAPGEPLVPMGIFNGQDPGQVMEQIEQHLADHPNDAEWKVRKILTQMAQAKEEHGLAELRQLVIDQPYSANLWNALGYLDVRRGDLVSAEQHLSKSVELDPKNQEALRNRAIVRHHQGKTRDAYVDLQAALSQRQDDPQALAELFSLYDRSGHRQDAMPILNLVLKLSPDNATARKEQWRLDQELRGNPDVAEAPREARTEVLPGLKPIPPADLAGRIPETPEGQKAQPGQPLVPVASLGANGPKAALIALDRQLAADPGNIDLQIGRVLALLGDNQTTVGLAALEKLLIDAPQHSEVLSAAGFVALRQGDPKLAEQRLSQALALDPRNVEAWRNRGILRSDVGRLGEAYADLSQALSLYPDDEEGLRELAHLYQQTGHQADSFPIVEHLARLRPNDPMSWVNLSVVQTDLDQALQSAKRAVQLAPTLPAAHRRHCTVLVKMLQPQAVAACTRALQLMPDDPSCLMHRGLAHYYSGEDRRALADMNRAVDLKPEEPSYLANRSLVESHAGLYQQARLDLEKACQRGHAAACAAAKLDIAVHPSAVVIEP